MFSNGKVLTGSIDGKGGSDTLDLSGYSTNLDVTLTAVGGTDGFNGNTTGSAVNPITGTFNNINVIDAGSGSDTLTGSLVTAGVWNLNAVATYLNTNTLTFSGFETLDAGAHGDTFNVLASQTLNLNGGAGADDFVFSAGKVLTGSIDGGAGSDTLDLSAYTTALTWTITGVNSGNVGPVTGGFTTMETLDGGSGGNTFDINASTSMSLNGGSGADDYVFANGKILTGSIDGKGGSDTLDFSAYTTAVNVLLTALGGTDGFNGTTSGGTNPITGGFNNIDVIAGTASGSLTGINTAATWDLGAGTYTSTHVLTFTGFSTLVAGNGTGDTFDIDANVAYTLDGGTGADDFVFSNGKVLTGSIDGMGGSDTLDLSAYTTALTFNITILPPAVRCRR